MNDLAVLTNGRMTALAADLNRAMAVSFAARAKYAEIYGEVWTPLTNADGSVSTGYAEHTDTATTVATTLVR